MSQQLENAGTKELAQKYLRHTLSITTILQQLIKLRELLKGKEDKDEKHLQCSESKHC